MNPFNIWIFLLIPLLWLKVDPTECEVHSLIYIYTGFSKPVDLPGIHQFTAMAQLDGQMLEYYDSVNQKLVPKQTWMEERLPAEYWAEGTWSRQHEQWWFKDNIDILMKRMGQNDADTHILQGMHGCEGDMQPDGTLKFIHGWDMYNYDGKDFFYDYINGLWVDQIDAVKEWESLLLKEYNRRQQLECMDWLSKFVTYGEKQLQTAPPPDVFVYAKNAKVSANAVLVCLATGFYPKDITLQIRMDGRLLKEDDGVVSSGVRPNGNDGTFQRRDEVEIVRADVAQFTCEVNQQASNVFVQKVWDPKLPVHQSGDFPIAAVAGAVVAILVLTVVVVLLVPYLLPIIGRSRRRSSKGSNWSISTNTTITSKSTKCSDHSLRPVAGEARGGSPSGSDSGLSTNNSGTPPSPESEHLMEETALSPSENCRDSLSSLQPTYPTQLLQDRN